MQTESVAEQEAPEARGPMETSWGRSYWLATYTTKIASGETVTRRFYFRATEESGAHFHAARLATAKETILSLEPYTP